MKLEPGLRRCTTSPYLLKLYHVSTPFSSSFHSYSVSTGSRNLLVVVDSNILAAGQKKINFNPCLDPYTSYFRTIDLSNASRQPR